VVIFSLYDEGRTTMAAAVSVWVLAVVLALAGLGLAAGAPPARRSAAMAVVSLTGLGFAAGGARS
jgi:hypothetical protein